MSKVDWSKAPMDAKAFAGGRWWFYSAIDGWLFMDANMDLIPSPTPTFRMFEDYEKRPTEWPTESRIDIIGTNGNTGEAYMHYDEQRESHYAKSGAREQELAERLYENRLKPTQPEQEEPAPLRKYDRIIKGKHNTGTCTVDVYRVLSAFEITEPELQHCIKKLLAAGQRGAKDYQQDLKEAAMSLVMLIDRLSE